MEGQNEQITELDNIKTIWHTNRFIQEIENSVRYHPVPYERLPKVIEIDGVITDSMDEIFKETMNDPEKNERATHAKIDMNGKMLVSSVVNVGTDDYVRPEINLRQEVLGENSRYQRREYAAFIMHTHGILDTPASFTDLTSIIGNFEQGGDIASFVITPTTKMIFIRSLETPEFDEETAVEIVRDWTDKLLSYVRSHLDEKDLTSDSSIQLKKNMEMILDFCREYKIAIYNSFNGHRYTRLDGKI